MYVGTKEREFLDGLQVGDLVVVARTWRDWTVRHVEKATAWRVWAGGVQFDRKTGREWGAAHHYSHADLCPLTTERVDQARKEIEERKALAAKNALMDEIYTALDTATIATLEQIRTLLSASRHAGNK